MRQFSRINVLSVYVEPAFLDSAACSRIRRAMDAGVPEDAEVLDATFERREEIRRARSVDPDALVIGEVETRLEARRETIARFFGVEISDREGAGFLRYPPGGFYALHRDRAVAASWPGAARRRIAVVVFLNSSLERDASGEFRGGTLRLFLNEEALDVEPQQGLLVAFVADLLHEVTEVRDGTRDAIVDWFYGT
jgi:predicted 2-oxoglutarate/Fe(II)-dependent dioxygenase YbiX